MAKPERRNWPLLGRHIGTATGWDQSDLLVMILYDYRPASGVGLPAGDITLDLEKGTATLYDDEGKAGVTADLVTALAKAKPAAKKTK